MKKINKILTASLLILVTLLFLRKEQTPEITAKSEPMTLEAINGSELKKVVLTAKAVERLGIKAEEVRSSNRGQKIISYSSLLYDLSGRTWVYTNPEPFNFIRRSIVVNHIEGENVYLSDGSDITSNVVTVGAAELYGAETGFGK